MKNTGIYYFYIVLGLFSSLLGFFVFFYVKPRYQKVTGIIIGFSGLIFAVIAYIILKMLKGG